MNRYRCIDCQHIFSEPLKAPHPFAPEETLEFCPACREVESGRLLCQVGGCDNIASCGMPESERYRHVCGRHLQFLQR